MGWRFCPSILADILGIHGLKRGIQHLSKQSCPSNDFTDLTVQAKPPDDAAVQAKAPKLSTSIDGNSRLDDCLDKPNPPWVH